MNPGSYTAQPLLTNNDGVDLTEVEKNIALRLWAFYKSGPLIESLEAIMFEKNKDALEELSDMETPEEYQEGKEHEKHSRDGEGMDEEMDEDDMGDNSHHQAEDEEREKEKTQYTRGEPVSKSIKEQAKREGAEVQIYQKAETERDPLALHQQEIQNLKEKIRLMEEEKLRHQFIDAVSAVSTYSIPEENAFRLASIYVGLSPEDRSALTEALHSIVVEKKDIASGPPELGKVSVYSQDATTIQKKKVSSADSYRAMELYQSGKYESYQEALKSIQ